MYIIFFLMNVFFLKFTFPIKRYDLKKKVKLDHCYYKFIKVELGWSGEDIGIPKLTFNSDISLRKKKKVQTKINKILWKINSDNFDKVIWLRGTAPMESKYVKNFFVS